VARLEDLVVFVSFVALGEIVEAEITQIQKKFAARGCSAFVTLARSSRGSLSIFWRLRRLPIPALEYSAQLQIKHKQVRDLFQRLGGFDPASLHQ